MVQSYQRHGPTQAFGLICSSSSNSVYDGKLAYVPALEDVLVWDVKKGDMTAMWHDTGHRAEVTCLIRSPQKNTFAVGYADGSIRLWDASTESVITIFDGHKKAVTALAFDKLGAKLASGSQDTDLIVWDVVAEAGLFRLHGHRDQITAIRFLAADTSLPSSSTATSAANLILTTSKDSFMKLWDLSTQHCIQTVVAHRSEIWSMDVDREQNFVLTGSGEGDLKAWKIDNEALAQGLKETGSGEVAKMICPVDDLPLSSRHRVSQITFHPTQPCLAVQSHDRSVEIFHIRTEDEMRKKQARRKKRAKEKKGKGKEFADDEMNVDSDAELSFVDFFAPILVVRANGRIRSFDFGSNTSIHKGVTQLFVATAENTLEVYNVPLRSRSKEAPPESARVHAVDLPGHRGPIRTLSLSSDDLLLASASNGSLKLWNIKTTTCIRTIDCGHAICSTFLPGDRHIAIGTKAGEILLYDIASSSLISTVKAHTATVWSLHVRPDGQALASGSADRDVKFWEIKDSSSEKTTTLVHIRTLKMTDDVLSVRYSSNGKLFAVSLLDSTVKVFYQDTLKFFLSLYGHKLPVLSMDISDDSKLLITGSGDKNVKIWGLDFGDCHKSIFAHDESVTQVVFEKNTHCFWTVGKDKLLKYWDGDKFENIQKLDGHHGEIWALAVSHHGNFVVTGSHDKSIRVWEKLDEPLFLEEERERELEILHDSGLADSLNRNNALLPGYPQASVEATSVNKQTTETMIATERIMEAIDLSDAERAAFREYEDQKANLSSPDAVALQPPPRNPVLAAYNLEPEAYVLRVVERVQGTALQDALLILPFGKVVSLMEYLNIWAQREWNITLIARIIFYLLKVHHHQIVTNRIMRTALIPLRKHLRAALQRQKETIGYNLAGLQYVRRRTEAERTTQFYDEGKFGEKGEAQSKREKDKKRKRVNVKG